MVFLYCCFSVTWFAFDWSCELRTKQPVWCHHVVELILSFHFFPIMVMFKLTNKYGQYTMEQFLESVRFLFQSFAVCVRVQARHTKTFTTIIMVIHEILHVFRLVQHICQKKKNIQLLLRTYRTDFKTIQINSISKWARVTSLFWLKNKISAQKNAHVFS